MYLLIYVSIEDAKQKAEYDRMLMMAEEKKSSVRDAIQSLRDQFQKLVARNAEVPSRIAVNRKVVLQTRKDGYCC